MLRSKIIYSGIDPDSAFETMQMRNPRLHDFSPADKHTFFASTNGMHLKSSFVIVTNTTGYSVSGATEDLLVISVPIKGSQTLSVFPDRDISAGDSGVIFPQEDFRSTLRPGFTGLPYITKRSAFYRHAEDFGVSVPSNLGGGGVLSSAAGLAFRQMLLTQVDLLSRLTEGVLNKEEALTNVDSSPQLALLAYFLDHKANVRTVI